MLPNMTAHVIQSVLDCIAMSLGCCWMIKFDKYSPINSFFYVHKNMGSV